MTKLDLSSEKPLRISVEEVRARLQSAEPSVVLDVRNPKDRNLRHAKIPGSRSSHPAIPIDPHWSNNCLIVAYDHSAQDATSARVACQLREWGFAEAYSLLGGFDAWQAADFPVEPLIVKGPLKAVPQEFDHVTMEFEAEWLDFLTTLTDQRAIVVDNASFFDRIQRMTSELIHAYDTMIEGWSRVLDLRDRCTEGHSRRVTEMTVRVARAMGMSESKLVHVRRGALLHDIGKLGIPDKILLKPAPLTEDEWEIMRRHPEYAYEWLAPISYLRPALQIPYCHHEKWNGRGYPRGLKEEQIPLEARIFAVVDIWDALRSDRPYRKALSWKQTLEHITSLAGTHLDPEVVEVFVRIAQGDGDDPTDS